MLKQKPINAIIAVSAVKKVKNQRFFLLRWKLRNFWRLHIITPVKLNYWKIRWHLGVWFKTVYTCYKAIPDQLIESAHQTVISGGLYGLIISALPSPPDHWVKHHVILAFLIGFTIWAILWNYIWMVSGWIAKARRLRHLK